MKVDGPNVCGGQGRTARVTTTVRKNVAAVMGFVLVVLLILLMSMSKHL
jgi:hypothetical protein